MVYQILKSLLFSKVNLLNIGKKLIVPIAFCCMILFSCTADKLELEPSPIVIIDTVGVNDTTTTDTLGADTCKFSTHIQPIINQNCALAGCHSTGFGSGDFSSYSGLFAKIDNNGPFESRVLIVQDMPPGGSLSVSDRDLIQCWLDNGATNN